MEETKLVERVRYGYVKDELKNTLVTLSNGNKIYFGISRCRSGVDRPDKSTGKEFARRRAEVAMGSASGVWYRDGSFMVHNSGIFGEVAEGEFPKLLNYFNGLNKKRARIGIK